MASTDVCDLPSPSLQKKNVKIKFQIEKSNSKKIVVEILHLIPTTKLFVKNITNVFAVAKSRI